MILVELSTFKSKSDAFICEVVYWRLFNLVRRFLNLFSHYMLTLVVSESVVVWFWLGTSVKSIFLNFKTYMLICVLKGEETSFLAMLRLIKDFSRIVFKVMEIHLETLFIPQENKFFCEKRIFRISVVHNNIYAGFSPSPMFWTICRNGTRVNLFMCTVLYFVKRNAKRFRWYS